MKTVVAFAAVLAAAVAVAVLAWDRGDSEPAAGAAAAGPAGDSAVEPVRVQPGSPQRSVERTQQSAQADPPPMRQPSRVALPAPLPPLAVPVVDVLQELSERADAGDAAAACRLAAEIAGCVEVEHFDAERAAETIHLSVTVNAEGNRHAEPASDYIARQVERQERCRGVAPDVLQDQARFDLAAARLGDLDAAVRFIRADSLDTGTVLRHPDLLDLYRQHAWPLFLRLLEAGHPVAAQLWSSATRKSALGAVMPADWSRPDVARALQRRVGGWLQPASLASPPSPEAEAEAERLYQAYFARSPLRPSGLAPPPLAIDPSRCGELQ